MSFSIVSLQCQLSLGVTQSQAPETQYCTVGDTGGGKCLCDLAEVERMIMNLYSRGTIHRHWFIWQFVSILNLIGAWPFHSSRVRS